MTGRNHTRRAARTSALGVALAVAMAMWPAGRAAAADIGQVKVVKGSVSVDRAGATLPATVGLRLQSADVVRTGSDGSVGITMADDSLLSAGPNSIVALERFEFDPTTRTGRFDTSLKKGTLAVVSGHMARQSPDAMTVRTPSAILGVRGTEFAASAHDPVSLQR
jgi:hypothetical protein